MSLQRMIVVSPEVFDKWKQLVITDEKLTEFDKSMKSILHNTKLNDTTKWQMYRHNLLKYINFKRNNRQNSLQSHKMTNHITDSGTQTKIFKKSREQQTDVPEYKNSYMQTEAQMDIFKHDNTPPVQNYNSLPNLDDEVFSNDMEKDDEKNSSFDGDSDESIIKNALNDIPGQVKIVKERKSMDPTEYRIFDLDNGDTLNVPLSKNNPRILRSAIKRHTSAQSTLSFPVVKKPTTRSKGKSNSTPVKMKWHQYK